MREMHSYDLVLFVTSSDTQLSPSQKEIWTVLQDQIAQKNLRMRKRLELLLSDLKGIAVLNQLQPIVKPLLVSSIFVFCMKF